MQASNMTIGIIGLGGTIAMGINRPSDPEKHTGLVVEHTSTSLMETVLSGFDGLTAHFDDPVAVASSSLTFEHLAWLANRFQDMKAQGFDGALVIQGTDTIEETSFALDLLAPPDFPVVMTGAMRAASHVSPDGPGNLEAALTLLTCGDAPSGCTVVLNDEVHSSHYVVKKHTTTLSAFSSGDRGPLGRIHEGQFRRIGKTPTILPRLSLPDGASRDTLPKVALITLSFDDDGTLIEQLQDLGYSGCVLETMGAGHVPAWLVSPVEKLARTMPVVLTSRTGDGEVCTQTYAYPGSEMDLLNRRVISGGRLTSTKARLALILLLAAGPEAAEANLREIISAL